MPDCKLLSPLLARVAALYPSTKFCSIVSDHCIENYPDKNCPTLLCYRKGEMTGQIVGMGGMGGNKATIEGAFFLGFVVPTFLRSFPPFAPSPVPPAASPPPSPSPRLANPLQTSNGSSSPSAPSTFTSKSTHLPTPNFPRAQQNGTAATRRTARTRRLSAAGARRVTGRGAGLGAA